MSGEVLIWDFGGVRGSDDKGVLGEIRRERVIWAFTGEPGELVNHVILERGEGG